VAPFRASLFEVSQTSESKSEPNWFERGRPAVNEAYHTRDPSGTPNFDERWFFFRAISRYNYDTLLSWRICHPELEIERLTGGIHVIRKPAGTFCECERRKRPTICK
jgi:hypothetical protein